MQLILHCYYCTNNSSTHMMSCSRSKRSERSNWHCEKAATIFRYVWVIDLICLV